MKIAFTGPSGVGKTTLCKFVEKEFEIPHLSTSASDVLTEPSKELLRQVGWLESGHMQVIQESVLNPKFALIFQSLLLGARLRQIAENKTFVIDRSPIDNMVYRLTQAGIHDNWKNYNLAFTKAVEGAKELDLIIFVKCSDDIPGIEDNKSRIPNFHYQQYITKVFEIIIASHPVFQEKVKILDKWDFDWRKRKVYSMVKEASYFSSQPKLFTDENI